jgi:hypothetical protein
VRDADLVILGVKPYAAGGTSFVETESLVHPGRCEVLGPPTRRTEGYSTLCRPWDPKSPHQLIRTGQRRGPDMPSSHRRKRSAHLRPPMRLRQPQWYHPGSSPWIAGPQGARLLPA